MRQRWRRELRLFHQRRRLRRWVRRSTRMLRSQGVRLVVEAPFGARFTAPPRIEISPQGLSVPVRPGHEPVTTIVLGDDVDLGHETVIEIRPDGQNKLVIGDHGRLQGPRFVLFDGCVELGRAVRVRDGCVLKSAGVLSLGARTTLSFGSIIHCAESVRIGEMVAIGERVSMLDSDHAVDGTETYTQEQPIKISETVVGDNVFVGANAVIMRGSRIGANCVIAAAAIVRGGDYEAASLIAGMPARVQRPLPAAQGGSDRPVRETAPRDRP